MAGILENMPVSQRVAALEHELQERMTAWAYGEAGVLDSNVPSACANVRTEMPTSCYRVEAPQPTVRTVLLPVTDKERKKRFYWQLLRETQENHCEA